MTLSVHSTWLAASNYLVELDAITPGGESQPVMYGSFLQNTGTVVDPGSVPQTSDPNALAFWRNLYDRAHDHNRMVRDQLSGNLPLRPVSVLGMSLEDDVLVLRRTSPCLNHEGGKGKACGSSSGR